MEAERRPGDGRGTQRCVDNWHAVGGEITLLSVGIRCLLHFLIFNQNCTNWKLLDVTMLIRAGGGGPQCGADVCARHSCWD